METLDSLLTASLIGGIYFTIQAIGWRYMYRVNQELNKRERNE